MSTIYVNGTAARDMQIFYGEVCVQLETVTDSTVTFFVGRRSLRMRKGPMGLQALRCADGRTLDQCRIEVRTDVPAKAKNRSRQDESQARVGRAG